VAVIEGSERFHLWVVRVSWEDGVVHRVRFARTGDRGPVPPLIRSYLQGNPVDLAALRSPAAKGETVRAVIYRAVQKVGYGETTTYGQIAAQVGTSPRAVGQAMAHNPTPLVIPCHRIIGTRGIGGFSPDIEIKERLLAMEVKGVVGRRKDRPPL
jgi:methylated-DNA-[protein]-cysteine S-methyltransferase